MRKILVFLTFFVFSLSIYSISPLKREEGNFNLFQKIKSGNFLKDSFVKVAIKREGESGKIVNNEELILNWEEIENEILNWHNFLNKSNNLNGENVEKFKFLVENFSKKVEECKGFEKLTNEQILEILDLKYEIENLLGLILKNRKSIQSQKFLRITQNREIEIIDKENYYGPTKVGTGWILDQKIYDPTVEKYYPTMPLDIMGYDEGASDTEVDDLGWVWAIYSFYFTDPLYDDNNQPRHLNPSYSIAVFLSPDGGSTWWLYEILYDPEGKDVINPRFCIDMVPTTNRFFIAYEYVYSQTDHDIYVYSEAFSSTPEAYDVGIATSTLMERKPDIASDFYQGQTSYRVVVYEKEYSAGSLNYDIYASQSTGNGSTWTSPIAVAYDNVPELNPSISNGASGYSTITQYMHLAYNYELYSLNEFFLNNGFENGNDGSWVCQNPDDIYQNSSLARTGNWLAWLGGYNNYTGYIYQTVSIPENALSVTFSYYLRIQSDEGTGTAYDFLYVELRDTSDNVLTTLKTYSNKDKNTYASYTLQSFDLSSFRGQTLRVYFRGTTDSSLITNFFIDDTSFSVNINSGHQVRYARAQRPGATPYPNGLQSATKLVVLSDYGVDFPYGPPSVVATHGGTSTMTTARVVVAAHQHFPADYPYQGDLERNQICFAYSMCNGGTSCGTMTCGGVTYSKNWEEAFFYDGRGDEMFPSLVVDGQGVVNVAGLDQLPFIYMAYFHRAADSESKLGEVQLILTIPYDETCEGFISGSWYYFTNSYTVSDPDNLVDAKERTINAFNYWVGWPGVIFNKRVNHLIGGENDDVFSSTLGDNYTFYTYCEGNYLDLVINLEGETYSTPVTFAWAAGYKKNVKAVTPQTTDSDEYNFTQWSNGQTNLELLIVTDYCDPVNPCPEVNFIAYYEKLVIPEVENVMVYRQSNVSYLLTWSPLQTQIDYYEIFRATDPASKLNYNLIGTTTNTSYLDESVNINEKYFYIIVGRKGVVQGKWGGTYDN